PNYNGAPPWGGTDWGCLLAGELNSKWIMFTIATSGVLQFSFGQNSNGGQLGFYDWAMWLYNDVTTCSAISGNTQPPVRCVWNAISSGGTGLANPIPAGGNAGNYGPPLNVTAGDQYIICFSNWSFATGTVVLDFFGTAGIQCGLVLPVDLLTFTAEEAKEGIALHWVTATEMNNDYFAIERSMDGNNWEMIGTLDGYGSTSEIHHYNWTDTFPKEGWNYYRLRQYDYNGMFKIVGPTSANWHNDHLLMWPNPASEQLMLRIDSPSRVAIMDLAGKLVHEGTYETSFELDVSAFPRGIYFVSVENGMDVRTEKLVLQPWH
ncbi:MAG: T9SS type A sorting domain-containing protein, partial [Flavobacteriales bacterium]|nr:T9SS type A sorting domain-containing protein [Flavobacteriales bacterium]